MQELTSLEFARHFKNITNKTGEDRFCFVLGSGASFQSGIPTGWQLAKKWLDELKADFWSSKMSEWMDREGIKEDRLGEYYAEIFAKRFEVHPQEGYDELNLLMERVSPSFGYSVLAQLLETKNNVVITTNFDNLPEEALFSFSTKRPLVCGHEYLASFAKISDKRPLIVKIHRDRQLNPLNKAEEIDHLKEEWVNVLNNIFFQCIPVFIGYGGNDGSLMNYLKEIRSFKNLFWCDLDAEKLRQDVRDFIHQKGGKFVKIDGFDELMFDLFSVLNLPALDKALVDAAAKRADDYGASIKKIQNSKAKSSIPEDKEHARDMAEKFKGTWVYYAIQSENAASADEKEEYFLEGLHKFPNQPELHHLYALHLTKIKKDWGEAEKNYLEALKFGPDDININGDYAIFLMEFRKDYVGAEKYYKQALKLAPTNAIVNGNYAGLLLLTGKKDEAEKYLLMAFNNFYNDILFSELWFYRTVYYPEYDNDGKSILKELIQKGIRSLDWNFQVHVERARQDNNPHIEFLQLTADILSQNIPVPESYYDL